ncbi:MULTISPECIES: hypothetical protein [Rhodococcus]|uniref:hypothetical protein n=1 Tax=Rhodococcus globerulus TaxID=33008 RepID=UPI001FD3E06F|nr:hypothetical protein [Rhodococcus globerulus]
MPVDFRAILTTLAALTSGALAAFALTNPPLQDWAIVASQSEIDRWISSGPPPSRWALSQQSWRARCRSGAVPAEQRGSLSSRQQRSSH